MGRVTKNVFDISENNPDIFLYLRLQNLNLQYLTMKQQNTSEAAKHLY